MNTRFCLKILAQGMRHEIQGVFVLRAVRDRVYRPLIGLRIDLEPALEQNDKLTFPRGRWTVEEEHTPPNIRAHSCCFKILHHPRQGFVDPKQVMLKEGVVFFPLIIDLHARAFDHVIQSGVRPLCQRRLLDHHAQVVLESFPSRCPSGDSANGHQSSQRYRSPWPSPFTCGSRSLASRSVLNFYSCHSND